MHLALSLQVSRVWKCEQPSQTDWQLFFGNNCPLFKVEPRSLNSLCGIVVLLGHKWWLKLLNYVVCHKSVTSSSQKRNIYVKCPIILNNNRSYETASHLWMLISSWTLNESWVLAGQGWIPKDFVKISGRIKSTKHRFADCDDTLACY